MALLMIVPLLLIVGYLFISACPSSRWTFCSKSHRGMRAGGIWSPLLGTVYLVVISLVIATPIGVLAAVYLNEYARDNWFTRIVNLAVVNLAGVPSIVHALFGLGAFVLFAGMGRSILAASLTLAIMTLPVIIASTKEALAAVPMAFREACWNVGATRWQTIRHIVLPNSISGILTGVILQVSRAAGETAPIMFTGAVFYKAIKEGDVFAYGLFDQCMALSMHLFTISTQVPDVPEALPYGTAVVLLATVLAVNCARYRRSRLPALAQKMVMAAKKDRDDGLADRHTGARGAEGRHPRRLPQRDSGHYRPGPVGQDHPAQGHQPHHRIHRQRRASRARSRSTAKTSAASRTCTHCAARSAWSRRCPWACRCRSSTTWPSRRAWPGLRKTATSTTWSSAACARRRCGTKSRTGSTRLGTRLSGGQQQRLTIARALSHNPEILCLDEFSIAVDPVTTMRIEDVLKELRSQITIILVTNLVQQARRLADRTVFLLERRVGGNRPHGSHFLRQPANRQTYEYVNGIFG